jgi:hypothetical protein
MRTPRNPEDEALQASEARFRALFDHLNDHAAPAG